MEEFFNLLASSDRAADLQLPQDFIYAGGNPAEVRRAMKNADLASGPGQDYVSRVLVVALSVSLFGTIAIKDGRIKKESAFGDKAKALVKVAEAAFSRLKTKPGHTVNSIVSAIPEISLLLVGGGNKSPQPSFLQMNLKDEVKTSLRRAYDDIIGQGSLGRHSTPGERSAREAAIAGQNASAIGSQEDQLIGKAMMKAVLDRISEKFKGDVVHVDETHPMSNLIEKIAANFRVAVEAMSSADEAFLEFLFAEARIR